MTKQNYKEKLLSELDNLYAATAIDPSTCGIINAFKFLVENAVKTDEDLIRLLSNETIALLKEINNLLKMLKDKLEPAPPATFVYKEPEEMTEEDLTVRVKNDTNV